MKILNQYAGLKKTYLITYWTYAQNNIFNPNPGGYKKECSQAAQGHIWPALRPIAGWLFKLRCSCACLSHRSSQRPEEVDSLCVPIWGTWKWNIANTKTVKQLFSSRHYTDPHSSREKLIRFACQYLKVEYCKSEKSSRILRASGLWNCLRIRDIPLPSASHWHACE
jgi:hypothetical protein